MGNRFLEGVFAPVRREHTLTELTVTGTIPGHLDGRYLRNGPNPIGEIDPERYHWFVGDGMVHGIRIRDGKAEWYRNRWVRGPATAAALGEGADGGGAVTGIGANTNVIGHAGKTLALVEGGVANYELTDELDTVGVCDFGGTLSRGYAAHPKRDPDTGELHAVTYSFDRGNTVRYSVVGVDGRARRKVAIEVGGSPMMHDFALTENYVVFFDLPVTFDARRAVEMAVAPALRGPARMLLSAAVGRVRIPDAFAARRPTRRGDHRFPYRWNPRYPARVGVMPREGVSADVRWFEVEPCYVFHTMNAFEAGDTLVLDVVRYPRMFDAGQAGPDGSPTLDRWIVDLARGAVRESRSDDRVQEFPRVDERRLGKRHRYGYTVAESAEPADTSMLFKHDLARGGADVKTFGTGKHLGEFVFHPNSPDAAEDDGVLMGLVYDFATDTSALAILDASSLEELARVHLPHRIPAGFHGNWVPANGGSVTPPPM
ncbi:carotenoid oxygenase family protein [Nocardia puris]|uniref:Dioxygenase n=1 Tax=Nocardia puris TaxID=208602 RepID=A0A366DCN1_9NOCA|nr:carotenoid oxygenase family protein [Nocardia puris]MBF6211176.1 carotenoid oxygenase family protein [Nocardia puris]MBF6364895.1 carotenoid oxygenase family protein [Nocardia puris]MBF6458681.1 carotenoid oxygenase family protein [Nocardia puris]RBO87820.1 carotenoid cleavage dioxygenase [Nocardia puris]